MALSIASIRIPRRLAELAVAGNAFPLLAHESDGIADSSSGIAVDLPGIRSGD